MHKSMDLDCRLNAAIERWRNELAAQQSLSPDARRELEGHFQDVFAEVRRDGLNDEEAFERARKRIGDLQGIDREFKRATKTPLHHWALAIVAWTGFIVSFFLPAYGQMSGWKSAVLQNFFWRQAMQGDTLAVHYLLVTVANLVMLVSPIFIVWGARDFRFVKWLRGLSLAAAVLVWMFIARLLANHNGHDMKIGCYCWAALFVLLCLASLLQPVPVKTHSAQTT
jgi:hypothetical protein